MSNNSQHALLSPSSASRWLKCTNSARLIEKVTETIGNPSSFASREGTFAHLFVETLISKISLREVYISQFTFKEPNHIYWDYKGDGFYIQHYLEAQGQAFDLLFNKENSKTYEDVIAQLDIIELDSMCYKYIVYIYSLICDLYLSYEGKIDVMPEIRVNLSCYVPESFGTIDALIESEKILHIIDFKYGKQIKVVAHNNTQLILYALGAYHYIENNSKIQTIVTHIVQPRMDSYTKVSYKPQELISKGKAIEKTAYKAYHATGIYTQGTWCDFCKAKPLCPEQRKVILQIIEIMEKTDKISDKTMEELEEIFLKSTQIKTFLASIDNYLLEYLKKGNGLKRLELRTGRTVRKWNKNIDEISKKTGLTRDQLAETKLKSLTSLEKAFKSIDFNPYTIKEKQATKIAVKPDYFNNN